MLVLLHSSKNNKTIVKRPEPNPNRKKVPARLAAAMATAELSDLAKKAKYVGSAEHKGVRWEEVLPRLRHDASCCPPHITRATATQLLQAGIRAGNVSEDFDGEMPRRVWYVGPLGVFEARLTGRYDEATNKCAEYKGWPEDDPSKLPSRPRTLTRSDDHAI